MGSTRSHGESDVGNRRRSLRLQPPDPRRVGGGGVHLAVALRLGAVCPQGAVLGVEVSAPAGLGDGRPSRVAVQAVRAATAEHAKAPRRGRSSTGHRGRLARGADRREAELHLERRQHGERPRIDRRPDRQVIPGATPPVQKGIVGSVVGGVEDAARVELSAGVEEGEGLRQILARRVVYPRKMVGQVGDDGEALPPNCARLGAKKARVAALLVVAVEEAKVLDVLGVRAVLRRGRTAPADGDPVAIEREELPGVAPRQNVRAEKLGDLRRPLGDKTKPLGVPLTGGGAIVVLPETLVIRRIGKVRRALICEGAGPCPPTVNGDRLMVRGAGLVVHRELARGRLVVSGAGLVVQRELARGRRSGPRRGIMTRDQPHHASVKLPLSRPILAGGGPILVGDGPILVGGGHDAHEKGLQLVRRNALQGDSGRVGRSRRKQRRGARRKDGPGGEPREDGGRGGGANGSQALLEKAAVRGAALGLDLVSRFPRGEFGLRFIPRRPGAVRSGSGRDEGRGNEGGGGRDSASCRIRAGDRSAGAGRFDGREIDDDGPTGGSSGVPTSGNEGGEDGPRRGGRRGLRGGGELLPHPDHPGSVTPGRGEGRAEHNAVLVASRVAAEEKRRLRSAEREFGDRGVVGRGRHRGRAERGDSDRGGPDPDGHGAEHESRRSRWRELRDNRRRKAG
mmetsp:Transcript_45167/g.72560  ORF Transcript_45167/g.72560 Transcript_45167/m.72560 type:complete len:681 (-) Transcript_45167:685-2727(-)